MDELLKKSKAIYVWRDGRDVTKSLHNYMKNHRDPKQMPTFKNFFRESNDHETFLDIGEKTRLEYWAYHVSNWINRENIHVVKYESLMTDYETQILKLSEFLEFPLSNKIFDPRSNSKLQFLKRRLLRKISGKNVATSVRFNKGKIGEWRNYCDKDDLTHYDQIIQKYHI